MMAGNPKSKKEQIRHHAMPATASASAPRGADKSQNQTPSTNELPAACASWAALGAGGRRDGTPQSMGRRTRRASSAATSVAAPPQIAAGMSTTSHTTIRKQAPDVFTARKYLSRYSHLASRPCHSSRSMLQLAPSSALCCQPFASAALTRLPGTGPAAHSAKTGSRRNGTAQAVTAVYHVDVPPEGPGRP